MHQKRYIKGMEIPELKRFKEERTLVLEEITIYRSLVEQLNWLS